MAPTPLTLPLLYSFRRCPYAIRARMALHGAGVPFVLEEVALRQKPPGLLAVSAKATVPVLVLPGGQVIDQSLDIMHWALQQSDPHGWLADANTDADTMHHASHWISLCDIIFKPLLDRYKYASRHPEHTLQEHHRRALQALIVPMQAQLAGHPWLLGARQSIADLALLPFVRQFAGVDPAGFARLPLPAVQAWLANGLASAWFVQAMQKPAIAASPVPVTAPTAPTTPTNHNPPPPVVPRLPL